MTQPSSGPGIRRGPAHRGATERLRRALIATVVSLGLIAMPAAVQAAESPSPSASPSAEPGVVQVSLTPIGRGVVHSGNPLLALSVIANNTNEEAPAASLITELGDHPITDPAVLDAWLDGSPAPTTFAIIDAQGIPAVPAGDTAHAAITVPADSPGIARAPGVYPLLATYGNEVVARSVIVVVDDEAPGPIVPVGVIVPITAGPQSVGLLSASALSALTAADGRLTGILDAVQSTTSVLAIDPAVLASIRVLGTAAPASAVAWLERLTTLTNPRFALQFGDADVSAQVNAGLPRLLGPTSLNYAMSPADFEAPPSSTPEPSSSPTPTPDEDSEQPPVLPDLATLLDVPGAIGSVYWPADGRTDEIVIRTLAERALAADPAAAPLTLLSSDAVSAATSTTPVSARVAGDLSALVYNARTSKAMQDAADVVDAPRGGSLAALSAHISLAVHSATGPLLLTADRAGSVTSIGLQSALSAVFEYPGVTAASWNDLIALPAAPVTLAPAADDARVTALQNMLVGEERVAAFATVLDDPTLLTGPERTAILQLIGAGWTTDTEWPTAIRDHAAATKKTLGSVSIQPPTTIQLLTAETPLPFYVRNALPWPVNVVLTATPDNLRLDVDRTTTVVAKPGVNTRVPVPVRARVGNGEVSIELRLLSPTAQQIGPVRHAEVHVRADWEVLGLIVLAVLVGGLFLIGLYRTVRRLRAAKAETDAADPAPNAAETPAVATASAESGEPGESSDGTGGQDPHG